MAADPNDLSATPTRGRLASLSAQFGGAAKSDSPTPAAAAGGKSGAAAAGRLSVSTAYKPGTTAPASPLPPASPNAASAAAATGGGGRARSSTVTPGTPPSGAAAAAAAATGKAPPPMTSAASLPPPLQSGQSGSAWDTATPGRSRSVSATPSPAGTPRTPTTNPALAKTASQQSATPMPPTFEDDKDTGADGKEIVCTPDMEYVKNPSHLDGLGDMCGLMYLEVPNILHNLATRYARDEIYTNINKVLIAVNPYKSIDIYHSGVIRDYRARALKRNTDLLPHVFTVAQGAYHSLFWTGQHQSLIVCGESGSGKTESAKHLMRYLASSEIEHAPAAADATAAASDDSDAKSAAPAPAHKGSSIEKQVLDCNPILEAFGNAKTVLNNNSSRFGKFTKLVFSANERRIMGSFIETYLLEKSRLVKQEKGERNYHVFYQLCSKTGSAALPSELRATLRLGSGVADRFHYLNQSGTVEVDGIDDGRDLTEMMDALSSIGMEPELQSSLFRIVAGILHLGNIVFTPISNDSCAIAPASIDGTAPTAPAPTTAPAPDADVKHNEHLTAAAELLGVDRALLAKRLVTRTIIVPPNQTITKLLNSGDAEVGRDTMTKALYNSLFGWIVRSMNKTLFSSVGGSNAATATSAGADNKEMLWIGILDVFGFERFENNSFEQLCINFANERLQQFFNVYILQSEQTEYITEAIFWTPLSVPSNQDVLDLIAGPTTGIMAVLDSSCRTPKATDVSFTSDLFSFHKSHRRMKQVSRVTKKTGGFTPLNGFSIKHYANTVIYNAKEFLPKNNDSTHPDTTSLFGASSNPVARTLFDVDTTDSKGRKPVGAQFKSVGNVFITQLASLMDLLNQTTPFFVRCVKPNLDKKPAAFLWSYVHPQLQCGGIVEALRILKLGFPSRCKYDLIHQRYGSILTPEPPDLNRRDFCEAVLTILGEGKIEKSDYQMGLTKVFFRAGKQAFMESLLQTNEKLPEETIKKIKKFLRQKRLKRAKSAIRVHIRFAIRLRRMRARVRIYRFAGVVRRINFGIIRRWKRIRGTAAATALQSYIRTEFAVRMHRKTMAWKAWKLMLALTTRMRTTLFTKLRRQRRLNAALILQSYIASHADERVLRAHVLRLTIRQRISDAIAACDVPVLEQALVDASSLQLLEESELTESRQICSRWKALIAAVNTALDGTSGGGVNRNLSRLEAATANAEKAGLTAHASVVEARAVCGRLSDVEQRVARALKADANEQVAALTDALAAAENEKYVSEPVSQARALRKTLMGEIEARAAMNAALESSPPTIDALRKALAMAKDMNLLSDPKAVECEKLLQKLLEQDRVRAALAKAVAAHSESECVALLERATAVELPETDESVVRARAWLKAAGEARTRVRTIVAARDSGGDTLAAALKAAVDLGLEFDPVIVDATQTRKLWTEASTALRAALDAQPHRTLPVLDSAVERAVKVQLNEHGTDLVEATKLRGECREADAALTAAIAAKSVDELDAAIKRAETLRFTSPAVTSANQLLTALVGESRMRAQLESAIKAGTIEVLQSTLATAKEMNMSGDPKAVEADKLLTKLLEQNRIRSALSKALAARDEPATLTLLDRAAAVELTTETDETVQSAQLWCKQIREIRKRLTQLKEARDSAGLTAAVQSAIGLGLEFDASVTEAQLALKGWRDAGLALRAACDAQPLRTLAVLDAAIERAHKSAMDEHDTDLVETIKLQIACRQAEAALTAAIAAKNAEELTAALKTVDSLRFGTPALAGQASALLITLGGEAEARNVMAAALVTGTVDALRRALAGAKEMKLPADDPKAVECDKLLSKLIEQDRIRAALTKAVAAHEESEVNALLERAAAVDMTEASDEAVANAKGWIKKLAAARKRLATLIEAREGGMPLTNAITAACEVGLEFDACVTDARATLKLWSEASSVCRAAVDTQPFITLPVLDAAIERATKVQLNENDPDLVEATKLRSKCRDAERMCASAVEAKRSADLSAAIKLADSLRYTSAAVAAAGEMSVQLDGESKLRAELTEALRSNDPRQLVTALEHAKPHARVVADPLYAQVQAAYTKRVETDKLLAQLTASVAERNETAVVALLKRAVEPLPPVASGEFGLDERTTPAVASAQLWLKRVTDVRARLDAQLHAKEKELSAVEEALRTALSDDVLGANTTDAVVVDAKVLLKALRDVKQRMKACIDDYEWGAALDAQLERATKFGLSEDDETMSEARRTKRAVASVERALADALRTRELDVVQRAIQSADKIRWVSDDAVAVKKLERSLIGENKARAGLSSAMASNDIKVLSAAIDAAKADGLAATDPQYINADARYKLMAEQTKVRLSLEDALDSAAVAPTAGVEKALPPLIARLKELNLEIGSTVHPDVVATSQRVNIWMAATAELRRGLAAAIEAKHIDALHAAIGRATAADAAAKIDSADAQLAAAVALRVALVDVLTNLRAAIAARDVAVLATALASCASRVGIEPGVPIGSSSGGAAVSAGPNPVLAAATEAKDWHAKLSAFFTALNQAISAKRVDELTAALAQAEALGVAPTHDRIRAAQQLLNTLHGVDRLRAALTDAVRSSSRDAKQLSRAIEAARAAAVADPTTFPAGDAQLSDAAAVLHRWTECDTVYGQLCTAFESRDEKRVDSLLNRATSAELDMKPDDRDGMIGRARTWLTSLAAVRKRLTAAVAAKNVQALKSALAAAVELRGGAGGSAEESDDPIVSDAARVYKQLTHALAALASAMETRTVSALTDAIELATNRAGLDASDDALVEPKKLRKQLMEIDRALQLAVTTGTSEALSAAIASAEAAQYTSSDAFASAKHALATVLAAAQRNSKTRLALAEAMRSPNCDSKALSRAMDEFKVAAPVAAGASVTADPTYVEAERVLRRWVKRDRALHTLAKAYDARDVKAAEVALAAVVTALNAESDSSVADATGDTSGGGSSTPVIVNTVRTWLENVNAYRMRVGQLLSAKQWDALAQALDTASTLLGERGAAEDATTVSARAMLKRIADFKLRCKQTTCNPGGGAGLIAACDDLLREAANLGLTASDDTDVAEVAAVRKQTFELESKLSAALQSKRVDALKAAIASADAASYDSDSKRTAIQMLVLCMKQNSAREALAAALATPNDVTALTAALKLATSGDAGIANNDPIVVRAVNALNDARERADALAALTAAVNNRELKLIRSLLTRATEIGVPANEPIVVSARSILKARVDMRRKLAASIHSKDAHSLAAAIKSAAAAAADTDEDRTHMAEAKRVLAEIQTILGDLVIATEARDLSALNTAIARATAFGMLAEAAAAAAADEGLVTPKPSASIPTELSDAIAMRARLREVELLLSAAITSRVVENCLSAIAAAESVYGTAPSNGGSKNLQSARRVVQEVNGERDVRRALTEAVTLAATNPPAALLALTSAIERATGTRARVTPPTPSAAGSDTKSDSVQQPASVGLLASSDPLLLRAVSVQSVLADRERLASQLSDALTAKHESRIENGLTAWSEQLTAAVAVLDVSSGDAEKWYPVVSEARMFVRARTEWRTQLRAAIDARDTALMTSLIQKAAALSIPSAASGGASNADSALLDEAKRYAQASTEFRTRLRDAIESNSLPGLEAAISKASHWCAAADPDLTEAKQLRKQLRAVETEVAAAVAAVTAPNDGQQHHTAPPTTAVVDRLAKAIAAADAVQHRSETVTGAKATLKTVNEHRALRTAVAEAVATRNADALRSLAPKFNAAGTGGAVALLGSELADAVQKLLSHSDEKEECQAALTECAGSLTTSTPASERTMIELVFHAQELKIDESSFPPLLTIRNRLNALTDIRQRLTSAVANREWNAVRAAVDAAEHKLGLHDADEPKLATAKLALKQVASAQAELTSVRRSTDVEAIERTIRKAVKAGLESSAGTPTADGEDELERARAWLTALKAADRTLERAPRTVADLSRALSEVDTALAAAAGAEDGATASVPVPASVVAARRVLAELKLEQKWCAALTAAIASRDAAALNAALADAVRYRQLQHDTDGATKASAALDALIADAKRVGAELSNRERTQSALSRAVSKRDFKVIKSLIRARPAGGADEKSAEADDPVWSQAAAMLAARDAARARLAEAIQSRAGDELQRLTSTAALTESGLESTDAVVVQARLAATAFVDARTRLKTALERSSASDAAALEQAITVSGLDEDDAVVIDTRERIALLRSIFAALDSCLTEAASGVENNANATTALITRARKATADAERAGLTAGDAKVGELQHRTSELGRCQDARTALVAATNESPVSVTRLATAIDAARVGGWTNLPEFAAAVKVQSSVGQRSKLTSALTRATASRDYVRAAALLRAAAGSSDEKAAAGADDDAVAAAQSLVDSVEAARKQLSALAGTNTARAEEIEAALTAARTAGLLATDPAVLACQRLVDDAAVTRRQLRTAIDSRDLTVIEAVLKSNGDGKAAVSVPELAEAKQFVTRANAALTALDAAVGSQQLAALDAALDSASDAGVSRSDRRVLAAQSLRSSLSATAQLNENLLKSLDSKDEKLIANALRQARSAPAPIINPSSGAGADASREELQQLCVDAERATVRAADARKIQAAARHALDMCDERLAALCLSRAEKAQLTPTKSETSGGSEDDVSRLREWLAQVATAKQTLRDAVASRAIADIDSALAGCTAQLQSMEVISELAHARHLRSQLVHVHRVLDDAALSSDSVALERAIETAKLFGVPTTSATSSTGDEKAPTKSGASVSDVMKQLKRVRDWESACGDAISSRSVDACSRAITVARDELKLVGTSPLLTSVVATRNELVAEQSARASLAEAIRSSHLNTLRAAVDATRFVLPRTDPTVVDAQRRIELLTAQSECRRALVAASADRDVTRCQTALTRATELKLDASDEPAVATAAAFVAQSEQLLKRLNAAIQSQSVTDLQSGIRAADVLGLATHERVVSAVATLNQVIDDDVTAAVESQNAEEIETALAAAKEAGVTRSRAVIRARVVLQQLAAATARRTAAAAAEDAKEEAIIPIATSAGFTPIALPPPLPVATFDVPTSAVAAVHVSAAPRRERVRSSKRGGGAKSSGAAPPVPVPVAAPAPARSGGIDVPAGTIVTVRLCRVMEAARSDDVQRLQLAVCPLPKEVASNYSAVDIRFVDLNGSAAAVQPSRLALSDLGLALPQPTAGFGDAETEAYCEVVAFNSTHFTLSSSISWRCTAANGGSVDPSSLRSFVDTVWTPVQRRLEASPALSSIAAHDAVSTYSLVTIAVPTASSVSLLTLKAAVGASLAQSQTAGLSAAASSSSAIAVVDEPALAVTDSDSKSSAPAAAPAVGSLEWLFRVSCVRASFAVDAPALNATELAGSANERAFAKLLADAFGVVASPAPISVSITPSAAATPFEVAPVQRRVGQSATALSVAAKASERALVPASPASTAVVAAAAAPAPDLSASLQLLVSGVMANPPSAQQIVIAIIFYLLLLR